jgi:hypothetical protein
MTPLQFPRDRAVGSLSWGTTKIGYQSAVATGAVEVPDDQSVHLRVRGEPSPPTYVLGRWRRLSRPADLSFLTDLPGDAITRLNLSGQIVPETFPAVTSLAPGLTGLCLGFTGLDDRALAHVAQLVNLTDLQTFGNTFTDAAVQQLVGLRRMRDLVLEEETLTVAAFDFVSELPDLIRLDMWDVQMTDDEHAGLRARLPGVDVGKNGRGPWLAPDRITREVAAMTVLSRCLARRRLLVAGRSRSAWQVVTPVGGAL